MRDRRDRLPLDDEVRILFRFLWLLGRQRFFHYRSRGRFFFLHHRCRHVKHGLQVGYLRAHTRVDIRRKERVRCYMSMQESSQVRERHAGIHIRFRPHIIEEADHLRIDGIQCLRWNGCSLRHIILEINQQRADMCTHLDRCERSGHEGRITDDRLDAGLGDQAVHQAVDRVLILRIIYKHKGVRRREEFLDLRLLLSREEDGRLAAEDPRRNEPLRPPSAVYGAR